MPSEAGQYMQFLGFDMYFGRSINLSYRFAFFEIQSTLSRLSNSWLISHQYMSGIDESHLLAFACAKAFPTDVIVKFELIELIHSLTFLNES